MRYSLEESPWQPSAVPATARSSLGEPQRVNGIRAPQPVRQCLLTMLEATPGVVTVANRDGQLLYMNATGRALLGVAGDSPIDTRNLADFYSPAAFEKLRTEAIPQCLSNGVWRGESSLLDRCGCEIPVSQVLTAYRDDTAPTPAFSSIAWDIRDHKRIEQRLFHEATHDSLTGLPNRALLLDRFSQAVQFAERHRRGVGITFVDLNDFKSINDYHGHAAGDRVLCAVAARLRGRLREEDTVSRYGGDEFVVLAPTTVNRAASTQLERSIRRVFDKPFKIGRQKLCVTASIGTAMFPEDGDDPEVLLDCADGLMFSAKRRATRSSRPGSPAPESPLEPRSRGASDISAPRRFEGNCKA